MYDILWQLLLQVLLIGLNAVFACAEIAVLSVSETKLERMAADGNRKAARLRKLTVQPARFLATIQVAITLSGFLGSAFAADNFSELLVQWLVGLGVGIPAKTLDTISVILITIILSYFTLVFGELVPKRLAMKKSEQLALGMSGLISAISKFFAPLVWLLTVSVNGVLRLLHVDPEGDEEEVSEEEIRHLLRKKEQEEQLQKSEKGPLTRRSRASFRTSSNLTTSLPGRLPPTGRKWICYGWMKPRSSGTRPSGAAVTACTRFVRSLWIRWWEFSIPRTISD